MKKLAFIFAHPDDAEIWAGGTILNHVIAHDEIKIIYTYVNNEERKNEAKTLEKLPHTTVEILDSPRLLRRVLKEYNPDIIVTHWEKDAHPEHRATYQLLYEQIPSLIIKEHLCFNLYVCDTYNSIGSSNSELFIPNVFIDVSEQWQNKIELISNHKSQPVKYWIKMISTQNGLYGARTKCEYAEAFLQISTLGYIYNKEKVLK